MWSFFFFLKFICAVHDFETFWDKWTINWSILTVAKENLAPNYLIRLVSSELFMCFNFFMPRNTSDDVIMPHPWSCD